MHALDRSTFHSSIFFFVRGFLALAMPTGTRPGRWLELNVVTMGGSTYVLNISNSCTAGKLHKKKKEADWNSRMF